MKFILPILFLTLLVAPLTLVFEEASYIYPVYAVSDSSRSATTKPTAADKLKMRAQELEDKKENTLKRLDDKKASVSARIETKKDKIASRAAELKEKLAKFRDKKKAERVERINENFAMINKNRTSEMLKHLERMSQILDKLEERVQNATSDADMGKVNEALKDANEAIDEAKTAVENQAAKDYTIVVNTESTVGVDAKTTRDSLKEDILEVHGLVVDARKTLTEAIRTVVTTLGGSNATK